MDSLGSFTSAQQAIGRLNINAASNDDLRALGKYITKASGTVIQTGRLMLDDFVNQSGIDANKSNGFIFDSVSGVYKNQGPAQTVAGPKMTSNTAPAGNTIASSNNSGNAYLVMNGVDNIDNLWQAGGAGDWVSYTNSARKTYIKSYRVRGYYQYNVGLNQTFYSVPTAWVIEGTNDKRQTWQPIDTRSGQSPTSTSTYTLDDSLVSGFEEVRFRCVSYYSTGGYAPSNLCMSIWDFTEKTPGLLSPMTLRSIVAPCDVQPSKASIWFGFNVLSGTPVLNSNIVAKFTRDGTQLVPFPLKKVVSMGSLFFVKADGLDLYSIQAGLSPAYQIELDATLGAEIDIVELSYGD